jgi:hypothetical protein
VLESAERGAGFDAGSFPSGLCRFGAGRSERSILSFAPPDIGGMFGIAPEGPSDTPGGPFGVGGGIFGSGGRGIEGIAPVFTGNATRDLQLLQFTNFAPAGTSASAMRLSVPQAEQVASIIRGNYTPVVARLPAPVSAWAGSRSGC